MYKFILFNSEPPHAKLGLEKRKI